MLLSDASVTSSNGDLLAWIASNSDSEEDDGGLGGTGWLSSSNRFVLLSCDVRVCGFFFCSWCCCSCCLICSSASFFGSAMTSGTSMPACIITLGGVPTTCGASIDASSTSEGVEDGDVSEPVEGVGRGAVRSFATAAAMASSSSSFRLRSSSNRASRASSAAMHVLSTEKL